jgi:hypothetical protein
MKSIAAYVVTKGIMMGLLPRTAIANHLVQSVMGVDLKMGNGRL